MLDVTSEFRYIQQLSALLGCPGIRRPGDSVCQRFVVGVCERPTLQYKVKMSDTSITGKHLSVKSKIFHLCWICADGNSFWCRAVPTWVAKASTMRPRWDPHRVCQAGDSHHSQLGPWKSQLQVVRPQNRHWSLASPMRASVSDLSILAAAGTKRQ